MQRLTSLYAGLNNAVRRDVCVIPDEMMVTTAFYMRRQPRHLGWGQRGFHGHVVRGVANCARIRQTTHINS